MMQRMGRFPVKMKFRKRTLLWCWTASGQKLACIYYEQESGRRSAAKLLTRDEARRIAANIAELPERLQRSQ